MWGKAVHGFLVKISKSPVLISFAYQKSTKSPKIPKVHPKKPTKIQKKTMSEKDRKSTLW